MEHADYAQHVDGLESGGGGYEFTVEETQQDWPAAFSTTGSADTWTWTAPDGTDQSANLTVSSGDTADYPLNGDHIIRGFDASGYLKHEHRITLGDPSADVPGAMVLPAFNVCTKSDPNSLLSNITAGSVDLTAKALPNSSDWAYLYKALAVPVGKNIRLWFVAASATIVQRYLTSGVFVSSDPTNPATTTAHATLHRWHYAASPNRYRAATSSGGGAQATASNDNVDQTTVLGTITSGPNDEFNGLLSSGFDASFNGLIYAEWNSYKKNTSDIAYVGAVFGGTQAKPAETITASVYVEVY